MMGRPVTIFDVLFVVLIAVLLWAKLDGWG
jgi:hypothetical protein